MPKATPIPKTAPGLGSRLSGQAVAVADLTERQRSEMYRLLSRYFRVGQTRFRQDLVEKEWVILLTDEVQDQIRGFSTICRFSAGTGNDRVLVFFSGDTIIDPEYWGQTALPRVWIRHILDLTDQSPETRAYWFLISSGYKTYRYLPTFFHLFYPSPERVTPPEVQALIDRIASERFGDQYDPVQGVIRFTEPTPLREGVAAVTERHLKDRHIAFFVQTNPGHAMGDELGCLTEVSRCNLTPAGRRMAGLSPERPRMESLPPEAPRMEGMPPVVKP